MDATAARTIRRSGPAALVVTLAARVVLTATAGLVFWTVVPALIGWHPTVVVTGSMSPRLHPGDVVVSRPVAASDLRIGQVLLFADPDHPGRLRLHRYLRTAPGGRLITKGDANASPDSSPVDVGAVRGVAVLRAPFIALPVLWLREGETADLVAAVAALGLLIAAARWYRPEVDVASAYRPQPFPRRPRPGPGVRRPSPRPMAPTPRRTQVPAIAVGSLVVLAAGVAAPREAAAAIAFAASTQTSTSTFSSARFFSCAAAARGSGATFSWPLGESAGPTANDSTGNARPGTYSSTGVTYGTTGPCRTDGTTAVTLDGATGGVAAGSSTVGTVTDVSLEVWFRASGTHGGPLMSVTLSAVPAPITTEALALNSAGQVTLGVNTAGTVLTTPGTWNDNTWHEAVGVVGANGMALYVDGRPAASSTSAAALAAVGNIVGTPYAGSAHAAELPAGTNDHFQGSLAFATFYKSALSAGDVAAHYAAAG